MKKYMILALVGILISLVISQSISMTNVVNIENNINVDNSNVMMVGKISDDKLCALDSCKVAVSGNRTHEQLIRTNPKREKPQPKKEPRKEIPEVKENETESWKNFKAKYGEHWQVDWIVFAIRRGYDSLGMEKSGTALDVTSYCSSQKKIEGQECIRRFDTHNKEIEK